MKTSSRMWRVLLLTAACVVAPATRAQEAPPSSPAEAAEDGIEEEIVVIGGRERGAVIAEIPPENQLDARDIRATGAATVGELLEAIAPQTGSGRGRGGGQPVVLLNGRRISGFREVRDLPPEAIERVDILPEEVALNYGYRADQRVVNIVLRSRFRSTTVRLEGELPTEGERSKSEADVTRLILGEDSRTTINMHLERSTALTEAERDIALAGPAIDAGDFRTLLGSSRLARLGGTVNRPLFGVSATIDGEVQLSDGRSLLGPSLLDVGEPLARDTNDQSGRLGLVLNGERGRWRWSLTGAVEAARSLTLTDREDAAMLTARRDRASSTNSSAALDLVAIGPLTELPAGRANATVKLGGDTRDLDSRTRRAGLTTTSNLARDRASASLNIDVPVADRRGSWSAIGDLSVNANAEVETLSDFDTFTTLGGGLYWSPIRPLNLIASYTREEGVPGLKQLGGPLLVTPNVRVFDFQRGVTSLVETVTGGNPDLRADARQVTKLGATLKPFDESDLEMRADYVRTRTDDPVTRFPGPTAAIEAAFPDRYVRDAGGNLVRVDLRAMNVDEASRDELRWGVNLTKPLKSRQPPQALIDQIRRAREGASTGAIPPNRPRQSGAAQGGDRGFGRGGPFGGGQGGRLTLSAYHTLLLEDEVRIAPGLPVLDFLGGDVAEGGSGQSRHRVEVEAGWFNNGLGARLSANWRSGSEVIGGPSGDLDFEPLARINLRFFANLGERFELVAKRPWLRGTQVHLGIDNLFDAKQRVRDAGGLVPINYQPDLLDPQGRTISLSIRKLFLPPRGFLRRKGGQ